MKKTLLTLGTLTTILAPIAIVVSCGKNEETQSGTTTQPQTLEPLAIAQWKLQYPQYANKIKGTNIVDYAFQDVNLPQGFSIPDGVTSIGQYAFVNTIFSSDLVISNSVTLISNNAFAGAIFNKKLILSNKLTSIGHFAFQNVIFSSNLVIPNSVISMDQFAFNLAKTIDENGLINTSYHWEDSNENTVIGPVASGKLSINKITSITTEPQTPLTISQWKLKYPQYANEIQGTDIIGNAFYGISFPQGFSIPDGVTSIGNNTFRNTLFNSDLIIPNSVTSIGSATFVGAIFNKKLILSNKLTSIGHFAFENVIFSSNLVIPDSVTSIGNDTFGSIKTIDSNGWINTSYHWEDNNQNTITQPRDGSKLVID